VRTSTRILVSLVLVVAAHAARTEPLTQMDQVYPALVAGRYDEVEAYYDRVRHERTRNPRGEFLFEEFAWHVYSASVLDPASPDAWVKVDAGTSAWVAHSPKSHLAAMTRAFALAYHARALEKQRGSWAEVDRLASEARRLMQGSKEAGSSDILWHAIGLRVASAEGMPRRDVRDMILAAAAADPYPTRLWLEAAIALSPDLRGTDDLGWLMRLAVQRTAAEEGTSMYARVLETVFWHFGYFRTDLFRRSGVDWHLLNASFEDWKTRYPPAYSPDLHAAAACAAMDQPMADRLLAQIAGHPQMDVWNALGGKGYLERCREFARPAPATPKAVLSRVSGRSGQAAA